MHVRSSRTALLLALAACAPAGGGAPGGPSPVAEIEALEARRFDAMVRRDTGALREVLAEDLVYAHSSGQVETRDQFLSTLASGALEYLSIRPEGVRTWAADSLAVSTGVGRMHVRNRGQEVRFAVRYTDVYVLRAGRWRMTRWQSTRIPDPPQP